MIDHYDDLALMLIISIDCLDADNQVCLFLHLHHVPSLLLLQRRTGQVNKKTGNFLGLVLSELGLKKALWHVNNVLRSGHRRSSNREDFYHDYCHQPER